MLNKLNIFKRRKSSRSKLSRQHLSRIFRVKYAWFKELLDSNTELLNIITDMEEKLEGRQVFGMSYIRSKSTRGVFETFRMVKCLNALSNNTYFSLYDTLEKISENMKEEVGKRKAIPVTESILPYSRITKEMVDWVGGKNANLGEIVNRVKLPIPEGFAITTHAFHSFLAHNDLVEEINRIKLELDPTNPQTVNRVSEEIQGLIMSARVPTELEEAIRSAYRRMEEMAGRVVSTDLSPGLSMRSSAIGEDSELSYAGQYRSSLNVSPDKLIETYKDIVSSLYTPQAIFYRLTKGVRDEDIAMSVACLQMVESVASGVMYSQDPLNLLEDHIIINAVWGLGPYAVDGVISPDTYTVAKDEGFGILQTNIPPKPVRLISDPDGGVMEVPVAIGQQDKPCLPAEQIRILAGFAVKLEKHYRCPQDIEWALDRDGRLIVLQCRPLHPEGPEKNAPKQTIPRLTAYPLLVEKGAVAFPGVGFGPAFHVRSEEELAKFPDGAVLVARDSSPKFVIVMQKAQAVVTDSGSATGHMASLAREFAVPSILDARVATANIPPGTEITVDAYSGRVYQGMVPELLAIRTTREPHMKNTPVYQTLRQVADLIVPLRLLDPEASDFAPQSCQSLHDIMRLVHEFSYTEMFQISDLASKKAGWGVKLDAHIPLDLYIIDLGGGLTNITEDTRKVAVDKVASRPFKALIKGMTHEDLRWREPRPIEFRGFLSVMSEQMLSPPNGRERFGDRSYAIISDKYLNFSSRVGYHYSVLDAYCDETINTNYITFSFKGGAADDIRRNRRARSIALMLKALDFSVEVRGDMVEALLRRYDLPLIEEKLDMVGRMLQFTRQMDMLMNSEASVQAAAKAFLEGNYKLEQDFSGDLHGNTQRFSSPG